MIPLSIGWELGSSWAASVERKKPWIQQNHLLPDLFFYCIIPDCLGGAWGGRGVVYSMKQDFSCCIAAVCSKQPVKSTSLLRQAENRHRKNLETWALYLHTSLSCLHPGWVQPCSYSPGRGQNQRERVTRCLQCQGSDTSCWASLCSSAWRQQARHPLWLERNLPVGLPVQTFSRIFPSSVSPCASHPNQVDQIIIHQSYPFIPHKSSHLIVV